MGIKSERENIKTSVQRFDAENEGKIIAEDLLNEIQPLISDYFIGDFKVENGVLNMTFLNGQKFTLEIREE